jgi:hypothetical protein
MARALSAVAHGSCVFIETFAVRMRLRFGFVTSVGMPFSAVVLASYAGIPAGAPPFAADPAELSLRLFPMLLNV